MSQDLTPVEQNNAPSHAVPSIPEESQAFPAEFYAQEMQFQEQIQHLASLAQINSGEAVFSTLAQTHQELAALYSRVGKKREEEIHQQSAIEFLFLAEAFHVSDQKEEGSVHVQAASIFEQAEKNEEVFHQVIGDLLRTYEAQPEKYLREIAYLKEFNDFMTQKEMDPFLIIMRKNRVWSRMGQIAADLAEIYVLKYAKDADPDTLKLAGLFSVKARQYLRSAADSMPEYLPHHSEFLYLPLCIWQRIEYIENKIKAAKTKQVLTIETEAGLNGLHDQWLSAQGEGDNLEQYMLSIFILHDAGRLGQYALRATHLEYMLLHVRGQGVGSIAQTAFLLSNAYCHLGQLDQAKFYLEYAMQRVEYMRMKSFSHDVLFFEEMRKTYSTQLEQAIEEQQLQAAQKEKEDASALLAEAMALSLDKNAMEEEKDGEATIASEQNAMEEEKDEVATIAPASMSLSPEEENARLVEIFQQEEKDISVVENIRGLILCYKRLPEKYEKHILYLEVFESRFARLRLKLSKEPFLRKSILRDAVDILIDLAELYLSQHAADRRSRSLELAHLFYDQAKGFFNVLERSILLEQEVLEFYVPVFMQNRLSRLGEKLNPLPIELENGVMVVTDAVRLAQLENQFAVILRSPPNKKIVFLTWTAFLSDILGRHALQVTCLEELLRDNTLYKSEAEALAFKVQSVLLLSNAYCHLGQLQEAVSYYNQVAELLLQIREKNFPYDQFFLQGMIETYGEQIRQAVVKQEAEEERELAQAMELSLEPQQPAEEIEGAEKKEEEEEDENNIFSFFGSINPKRKALLAHIQNTEMVTALIREASDIASIQGEIIPGWVLEEVTDYRNYFYAAVAWELEKSERGRAFLRSAPKGMLPGDYVRQNMQERNREGGEGTGPQEVLTLVSNPLLPIVVALVDTHTPDAGFTYYYTDALTGLCTHTQDPTQIPQERIQVRLAYTGTHYLSVKYTLEEAPLPNAPGGPHPLQSTFSLS